ncbi:copper homeostasis membrane protein CopD [uncultured Caulobacter sp.]|uniref:copper homeostasis membrane protein CopD n=1 Tax=uncultured Caulobacter sp. TaxID=158749 RepID=UPI0026397F66|nr:copper homeostasis membrane protein CopD [uncultured Caulobacter sp.]
MEAAVVLLRWAQFGAGFVLAGGALFALYALPAVGRSSAQALGWPRRLLAGSAAMLLLASLAGLVLQTAVVAGSLAAALDPTTLASVLTEMAMGLSSVTRAAAAAIALAILLLMPCRRAPLAIVAHLGAIAVASMAWMGHGAASDGAGGLPHLAADIIHLLAAAVWIGALAFFLGLAGTAWRDGAAASDLHAALAGFSGLGTGLVAALVVTGLVNSWFLVGPAGAAALFTTLYGQLLLLKIALFTGMILLAAVNRFRLTPALRQALGDPASNDAEVKALRQSLILELGAGLAVLALVAWLGRLAPITAQ